MILKKINQTKAIDLSIQRDLLKGKATLYLKIDKEITDSMVIGDLDFKIDSLIQLNDTVWKYIYSFGSDKSHSMFFSRQILIQEVGHKIHIPFISLYQFNMNVNAAFVSITHEKYNLNLKDSIEPNIKMSGYSIRKVFEESSIDSSSAIAYLKYDPVKKVYYTSIDILNGEFQFEPKEQEKRRYEAPTYIYLDNAEVMSLKIERSHFVYYKNKWFIVITFPENVRLIPFIPMEDSF